MTTIPIHLSPLHIISQSFVKWTNEWRTVTGHRKVMQLSLLFNSAHDPPFEPVTSHFSYFVSKLSGPDSGSQAGWGGPGSTWGCPLPRAMNPPSLALALRTSATILPAQLLPLLTPILDKGYLSHPEQPVPSLTRVASVQCFAVRDTPAPFQSPPPHRIRASDTGRPGSWGTCFVLLHLSPQSE